VVSFDDNQRPSAGAFDKLQSLLPPNDQCVRIDDPLSDLLDRIQAGEADQPSVRYLLSRLRAGEEDDKAQEVAVAMMGRSFAAYQAKASGTGAAFSEKITALQTALADNAGLADAHAMRVAAFTGMPSEPLEAAMARMERDLAALPSTIVGWSDWLVDFFCEDIAAFEALFGNDLGAVALVARGVKKGGPPTSAQFEVLKAGLRAWLTGRPLREIEMALGVAPDLVGVCKRARDLVLKLANRKLYIIAAAISELAKIKLTQAGAAVINWSN
jgi:ATP-dependent RNA helicase HelY